MMKLKSPYKKLREEVKSSHNLRRIHHFFEQTKKAQDREQVDKKVKDMINKHETDLFYKRSDQKLAKQDRAQKYTENRMK